MEAKGVVVTVLGLLVLLQLAVPILGTMSLTADNTFTTEAEADGAAFVDVTGSGYTSFAASSGWDSAPIESATVNSSTGKAVRLTGSDDSYVSASGISLPEDDTWSACIWVELNAGASESATYRVLNVEENLHLNYNNGSYDALYYDSENLSSVTVSVPANAPKSLTLVCVSRDGSSVSINRNGNVSSTVTLQDDSAASSWDNGTNCPCRLEELRVTDDRLNDSQMDTLRVSPVAPMPAADPVARMMFDAGDGDRAAVFWGGSATLSNALWTEGFDGSTLSEGADYELDYEDANVKELNDAPALYVIFERGGSGNGGVLGETDESARETIQFAGLIAVVLIGLFAISRF